MKAVLAVVIVLLAAGSLVGSYFAYNSIKLRQEVKAWKLYHDQAVEKLKSVQKDYAGVSVYKAENDSLIANTTPEMRQRLTVFYGASITKNWDLGKYFPGKNVLNRGVGSQSDTQLLARFPSDVLELKPGQVIIKFCSGNFTPPVEIERMWDEYEMMARMARDRGIEPILATTVPVCRSAETYGNYKITQEIVAFNSRIKDFARANNFKCVDYYAALADKDGFLPDEWAKDSIHPNEKGYEKMSEEITGFLN